MNGTRGLGGVISDLRGHCTRILAPMDDALTSIQQQDLRDQTLKDLIAVGISFERFYNDGSPKMSFQQSHGVRIGSGENGLPNSGVT